MIPAAASSSARWEHFPHDADVGVRGFGESPGAAFEQAALAMTAAIVDPAAVRAETVVNLDLRAPALDFLLLDWLNALVYEMVERRMVFCAFDAAIEKDDAGFRLRGRAQGEPVSRLRHAPAVEVKGATFTELACVQDPSGVWRAQCVIDV